MAPSLFNLYACLVVEQWTEQMRHVAGAGMYLRYKLDGKLFRRSIRDVESVRLLECQFADAAAIYDLSIHMAGCRGHNHIDVAGKFGLTVNLLKTKLLVMGYGLIEEDMAPIVVGGDTIERVDEFPYLGSVVISCGRIDAEVDRHLAGASRAFGALRHAVFNDSNLTITTKRKVYQSCVLSVLLYGRECWTTLRKQLNRLNAFHHRYIRTVQGITNKQSGSNTSPQG